jgi:hypothetical protein
MQRVVGNGSSNTTVVNFERDRVENIGDITLTPCGDKEVS